MRLIMNLRFLTASLLLMALFSPLLSLPIAGGQSTGTTTTMTISEPASQGQCNIISLAFLGHAGTQITGTYGSDVSINFYILSQNDLNSIHNCRLDPSVRPIFLEEKSVGSGNPYRSLTFPMNGTYYFVFMFVKGPTQLTKGYATVVLSFPSSLTIVGASGNVSNSMTSTVVSLTTSPVSSLLSTSITVLSSTSTSSSYSVVALTSNVQSSAVSAVTSYSAPSFLVFGTAMPLSTLVLVVGGAAVAVAGIVGVALFRNKKRRTLSNYLAKIDSTYNEFAVDREECRTRLERLKSDVIEMLNKGRIDEGHFLMLDEKISEYMKDLIQATPKYKRTLGPAEGSVEDVGVQATGQIKYCSNCGAKLSVEDKVCKRCGTTQVST